MNILLTRLSWHASEIPNTERPLILIAGSGSCRRHGSLVLFPGSYPCDKRPGELSDETPQQKDHEVFVWPKGVEIERRLGMGSYEKVKTIGFDPNSQFSVGLELTPGAQTNLESHLRYKEPKAQELTCDCRQFDKGSHRLPKKLPLRSRSPGARRLKALKKAPKLRARKQPKPAGVEGFAWD